MSSTVPSLLSIPSRLKPSLSPLLSLASRSPARLLQPRHNRLLSIRCSMPFQSPRRPSPLLCPFPRLLSLLRMCCKCQRRKCLLRKCHHSNCQHRKYQCLRHQPTHFPWPRQYPSPIPPLFHPSLPCPPSLTTISTRPLLSRQFLPPVRWRRRVWKRAFRSHRYLLLT